VRQGAHPARPPRVIVSDDVELDDHRRPGARESIEEARKGLVAIPQNADVVALCARKPSQAFGRPGLAAAPSSGSGSGCPARGSVALKEGAAEEPVGRDRHQRDGEKGENPRHGALRCAPAKQNDASRQEPCGVGQRQDPQEPEDRARGRGGCGDHECWAGVAAGIASMARSASAVIVSDGFTPGLADTAEPSTTKSPG
jgi:hypothetical protein